jgi:LIVCS family branched-chain amino acid:cation transporter
MLFALFFGAGNMIFPPSLGQAAGTHFWAAIAGFIVTGVGLPLLGVIAIAISGENLQSLGGRVHPVFGVVFTTIVYLSIGPVFAIPRTGTVAFEMGAAPLLPEGMKSGAWSLFLYTLVYFAITLWLSLNPTKLVDRIGKILTPLLLITIAVISIQGIVHPIGPLEPPAEAYQSAPFFGGFVQGYLTMDAIAALVFGIVVITAVQERGVKERKQLALTTLKAAVIAAIGLALVYIALGYLGASSRSAVGATENGGQILTAVTSFLFGSPGTILLGAAITLACLTTSVGLVTSCGQYFSRLFPKLSYKAVVCVMCLFSLGVANLGLTQIISFSVPLLMVIYPLAIVLIILSIFHPIVKGSPGVYLGALVGTALVSVGDGLQQLSLQPDWLLAAYDKLPFYAEGIGWLLPALAGGLLGCVFEGTGKRRAWVLPALVGRMLGCVFGRAKKQRATDASTETRKIG